MAEWGRIESAGKSRTESGELFTPAIPGLSLFQRTGPTEPISGMYEPGVCLVYSSFLEPVVISFLDKYPEVTVEIFFEDQQVDLDRSGLDLN
jgi:DNA-binding transcriptional LysR family regulator